MIDARTTDELVAAAARGLGDGRDWLVLGGGSNLFVGDEPFDGTVVRVLTHGHRADAVAPAGIRAAAGAGGPRLGRPRCVRGRRGARRHRGDVGHSRVRSARRPCRTSARTGRRSCRRWSRSSCSTRSTGEVSHGAGRRARPGIPHVGPQAPLRVGAARPAVILSVTLELAEVGHGERPVAGAQLRPALGLARRRRPSRSRGCASTCSRRGARKGMVLDDADPDTYSAGSFFQNAIVSASFARTLPAGVPALAGVARPRPGDWSFRSRHTTAYVPPPAVGRRRT